MTFCTVICSTAKARMLLDQRKKLVRCNVDSELLTTEDADQVLVFVSQVLDPKSDTSGSGEEIAAAKVLKDESAALWPARWIVCGGCAWLGCYASAACSYTALHLNDV